MPGGNIGRKSSKFNFFYIEFCFQEKNFLRIRKITLATPGTFSASYLYIREEEEGLGVWSTCWKRGVKMRRNIVASNFQVKLERPKGSACKVTLKLIRELRVFISKLVCKLPEDWSVR